jgi:hypothetical protein
MSTDAPASAAARQGTIDIQGRTLVLANVLGAEAKRAEHPLRNGFFLFTGMICPILAMIFFSILSGPAMWALGLLAAAAPFIGMAATFVWKKPWGVVVEMTDRYRTVLFTSSKDDAERLAGDIRKAIAA